MNQDPTETRMRELSWRPKLTEAEAAELRAWLGAHPEAATRWQEEGALNALLEKLADAPVPSNFTSLVMQAIERGEMQVRRAVDRPWWRHDWMPRVAFATVLCAGLGLAIYVHQRNEAGQRIADAEGLIAVSGTKEVLSVEVLRDFDSIAELGPRIEPDTELLSLLQ